MFLLIEDQVFKRRRCYELMLWDQPSKLPLGIVAVTGGLPRLRRAQHEPNVVR